MEVCKQVYVVSRSRSLRVPGKLVSKADEVKTRAFFLERWRSKTRLPANFHLQLACRISCLEYNCTLLPLLRCVPPIFTHWRRNGKLFMNWTILLAAQSVIAAFQFSAREGPVKASRGEERGGGAAVVGLGGPEKRRMGKGPREMGERDAS